MEEELSKHVIKLRQKGKTFSEIGRALGLSASTACTICRAHGVARGKYKLKIRSQLRLSIEDLLTNSSMSQSNIAEMVGVSRQYVSQIAKGMEQ